jgi:hypothetical protein
MQVARPGFATRPKIFGKGPVRDLSTSAPVRIGLSSDLKLFATTFVAGFLFVSILIG